MIDCAILCFRVLGLFYIIPVNDFFIVQEKDSTIITAVTAVVYFFW